MAQPTEFIFKKDGSDFANIEATKAAVQRQLVERGHLDCPDHELTRAAVEFRNKYFEDLAAAQRVQKQIARELENDDLKGKVDFTWFGHTAFKIGFKDAQDEQHAIYINMFMDQDTCPADFHLDPPNDADLCLVTQG